jgi:hypothetical protein
MGGGGGGAHAPHAPSKSATGYEILKSKKNMKRDERNIMHQDIIFAHQVQIYVI